MEAAIIILFFFCLFLFFCFSLALRKIYKLQEKIIHLENISHSIKKVLLEKTPQIPNDIYLYNGLTGFEEQYYVTKTMQEKEGKNLFNEVVQKALLRYHYEKRLNDIVLELYILNIVKEINYLKFYALYQKHQHSRENFAKALELFFEDEILKFGDNTYDGNKKKFIEKAKEILKDEKDQRILITLNSLDKSILFAS